MSGHTTIAFALATVLTGMLPGRWRWVPYPLACGVGFARIYYGAHLPLDVLGGAGLGILCGLVASVVFGTIDPNARRRLIARCGRPGRQTPTVVRPVRPAERWRPAVRGAAR